MEAKYDKVTTVTTETNEDGRKEISSWVPLIRQMYICSAAWFGFFVAGISYGTPTVMIPQLRKYENSTITISMNSEALLKSVYGYAAMPWTCLLTWVTIVYGRRIPVLVISLATMSGYILLYFMKTTTHIVISEILQASSIGACTSVGVIILSEYAAPRYRGVFLTIKAALAYWGIWIANSIGAFCPWRHITILGIVCSLFMLPVIFFSESPSWLASKGRFEESRKAHRWLRGTDEDSEQELEKMIKSQEEYIRQKNLEHKHNFKNIMMIAKSGEFYKPFLLAVALSCMYHCSGKLVCVMYSIDIIKSITDSDKMAIVGMLSLDGISILGMYTGSFVTRYVPRRMLLFTTSFTAIIFLFILSFYLYLIKLAVISENHFISITLLALFSLSISSGVILIGLGLFGEIFSLKYRSVSILISSVLYHLIYSIVIQSSPYIFKYFGLHGAFFTYGVLSSIFTAICYKYLPETKDKTLLEIEEYFRDAPKRQFTNIDVNAVLISDTVGNDEVDK